MLGRILWLFFGVSFNLRSDCLTLMPERVLAAVCLVWCEPQLPLSMVDSDGKDELSYCL